MSRSHIIFNVQVDAPAGGPAGVFVQARDFSSGQEFDTTFDTDAATRLSAALAGCAQVADRLNQRTGVS